MKADITFEYDLVVPRVPEVINATIKGHEADKVFQVSIAFLSEEQLARLASEWVESLLKRARALRFEKGLEYAPVQQRKIDLES
jgi:hypothetical protein